MDYQKIYRQIIKRAKVRVIPVSKNALYVEYHHIIPRCIGGKEVVPVTAKEHFLCHYLLTKMFPVNKKIRFAFWGMCNGFTTKKQKRYYKITSKVYNNFKIEFSKMLSNIHTGVKLSDKHKAKISNAMKNRIFSKEHCKNISISKIGSKHQYYGKTLSTLHRHKISVANTGRVVSPETRLKISISNSGKNSYSYGKSPWNKDKKQTLIECNICHKIGGQSVMKRWHFNRCKLENINSIKQ